LKKFGQTLIENKCIDAIIIVNDFSATVHKWLTFDHQTLIENFPADFD
jgi:hypothetical protein